MCEIHKYLHAYPAVLKARLSGSICDAQWSYICSLPDFSDWLERHQ